VSDDKPHARFPRQLYTVGTEPDARFSLANERTFLAWIRTALALIAGGVALEALALGLHPGLRLAASIVLVVAGLATPIQAWFGWVRVEKALRLNKPLPSPLLSAPLGIAVVLVGILVLLAILFA
jgi:putative membrane protein